MLPRRRELFLTDILLVQIQAISYAHDSNIFHGRVPVIWPWMYQPFGGHAPPWPYEAQLHTFKTHTYPLDAVSATFTIIHSTLPRFPVRDSMASSYLSYVNADKCLFPQCRVRSMQATQLSNPMSRALNHGRESNCLPHDLFRGASKASEVIYRGLDAFSRSRIAPRVLYTFSSTLAALAH